MERSLSLAERHRRDQRQTVAGEALNAAAAARIDIPSSTAHTSANRPANPSVALR
jgi:hypothetical protein